ncbi:MAG: hypothetical protein ACT452_08630 [Microthrixaceae bacterium]
MRKLRLGVVAGVIAAIATLAPATPASAHTYAAAGVYTGNASTSGLWFPASPFCPGTVCSNTASWSFSSALDVIVDTDLSAPVGAGRISGGGSLLGYCGGSLGTGNANLGSESAPITFVTVGGTGVLAGVGSAAVVSTFQARPLPSAVGQVPCLTEPATNFLIVGAGAAVAAA